MRLFDDVLTAAQYDATDLVNYPHGRVKDDTTSVAKDGTPIMEKTWGDIYNGIVELLRIAGITSSGVAEKKGASDLADAVGFLNPVMIIKVGYDATVKVLGGAYKAGYTAAYTTAASLTGAIANKLTINKDGVLSTENYFVDVTIVSSVDLKAQITAGASHGTIYFDNDDSNIYISANSGGTSDADLQKVSLIIKVFKV